eukprot:CAMPEP_0168186530 /NCGR_PEP_ID=MMETSP0139_2-20121125/14490_1 /TAXON_ID=44445 /ORGANISM="Pseudo-nitzschia australis, Strain 10249 10 AB" /LENGTH=1085 /DNA_ID=CAMNT_0008108561 /DNA_START=23 /DNA_END=3281 /DNA_ORIENTATION=-
MRSSSKSLFELKNGFLCSSAEIHASCGPIPLLGSMEALVEKFGFEVPEDYLTSSSNGNANRYNPLVALSVTENEANNKMCDAVSRTLDDLRALRHRIEDGEEGEIGGLLRKKKRRDVKVSSLERQRAKLKEKQQKQNEIETSTETSATEEENSNINNILANNEEEMHEAWIRIARFYNSVRLMLFLFSDRDGLEILGRNNCNECTISAGFKGLDKLTVKLYDILTMLVISSTRIPSTNTGKEKVGGDNAYITDYLKSTMWVLNYWLKIVNTSTMLESIGYYKSDDYDIALTDDSSEESKDGDSDKIKMGTNADADKSTSTLIDIPNEVSACFLSWNTHIDKLMEDLLSATNTRDAEEGIAFLEQALSAWIIDNDGDGDAKEKSATLAQERAKKLDDKFSLLVAVSEGKEQELRQKYLLSIEKLRRRIENRIRKGTYAKFKDARLEVYGSCLSGLSLGKNADVDLSLTFFCEAIDQKKQFEDGVLTANKYSKSVTDSVFQIKRKLEQSRRFGKDKGFDFTRISAIPRARVPVIKGIYRDANNPHSDDGTLHFDICLLNDIAVANSGLIKEYSDVDIRVKSLMITVKRWTKDKRINSAQDNTLSSYAWMNLVVYYLQCIEFVPNLQCPVLMKKCNYQQREDGPGDNINNLDTAYLKWFGQVEKVWKRSSKIDEAYGSVSMLLYGFFRFYSLEFPTHLYMVSIKRGGAVRLPKTMFPDRTSIHLCIEDPFETYDSHFPHDLGTHADEKGSIFISKCLRDSAEYLRQILFTGEAKYDDGNLCDNIQWVIKLWPEGFKIDVSDKPVTAKKRRSRNKEMTVVVECHFHLNHEQILRIFQPFADQTKSFIIGSSMSKARFQILVDYDSEAAVLAALKAHEMKPLEMNGIVLAVSQYGGKNKNKGERKQRGQLSIDDHENPQFSRRRYDPEKVLIIHNLSGNVAKRDIMNMFRPYAEKTGSRIIAVDLVKGGTLAFVDFDSVDAVHAVLTQHAKTPFKWNYKALDVAQKSLTLAQTRKQQTSSTAPRDNGSLPKGRGGGRGRGGGGGGRGRGGRGQRNTGGSSNGQPKQRNNGNNNVSNKPIVDSARSIEGQL